MIRLFKLRTWVLPWVSEAGQLEFLNCLRNNFPAPDKAPNRQEFTRSTFQLMGRDKYLYFST